MTQPGTAFCAQCNDIRPIREVWYGYLAILGICGHTSETTAERPNRHGLYSDER